MKDLKQLEKYALSRLPKLHNLEVFATIFTNSSVKAAINLEVHINKEKLYSSTSLDIDDAIIDIYQKMYNNLYYKLENVNIKNALLKQHVS